MGSILDATHTTTDGTLHGMKLSVSLSDSEVAFIDEYAHQHGVASRSAVVQAALDKLRLADIAGDYDDAFQEWADGDNDVWDVAVADGLDAKRRK